MNQESDGRTRRGMPVPHVFRHRQDRLLARERLAQDAGEKSGCRLVGKARADADGGQANADPIHKAAPRIIGKQKFADRLLGAVAQKRRVEKFIADRFGEWRAEYRDRRSEDEARLVAVAGEPDRIEQHPRAVEIDAIALIEIKLGLARDDRGEMKDHLGAVGDQLFGGAGQREVARYHLDRKAAFSGFFAATTSCSVILVMSFLPSRPSATRRSTNLRPTMPAAPRTRICKAYSLEFLHRRMAPIATPPPLAGEGYAGASDILAWVRGLAKQRARSKDPSPGSLRLPPSPARGDGQFRTRGSIVAQERPIP